MLSKELSYNVTTITKSIDKDKMVGDKKEAISKNLEDLSKLELKTSKSKD